mmetsp:Transcript_22290/g.26810  ORF Transcript_22290/g.26810 Transcript_22290/m.26810 type:complete len:350 (+) Transcript_22290:234-1283(+)
MLTRLVSRSVRSEVLSSSPSAWLCRPRASNTFGVRRASTQAKQETPKEDNEPNYWGEEPAQPSNPAWSAFTSALTFGTIAIGTGVGYAQYKYDVPEVKRYVTDLEKTEAPDSLWLSAAQTYLEKREVIEENYRYYADPSSDKLLPDLPEVHKAHVRTLILDLDDLLVYSDWNRERGWRTFKRPGADIFIQHMAQLFEVVVYTDQLNTYADPIIDRIDPDRFIVNRLYRDATQYIGGEHVRDLGSVNRDLNKVIFVSANPQAYVLQPENALPIKKWEKDASDRELLNHMPFLEAIARQAPPDVRPVLSNFLEEAEASGKDIPTIYKERMQDFQKKYQEQQRSQRGFGKRG